MREQALVKIEELLNGIHYAVHGVDIKKVSRDFFDAGDESIPVTHYPCLIIVDDGQEEIEHLSGLRANVSFDVSIFGYAHGSNISTKINKLDKALKIALLSDVTLGGLVDGIIVKPYIERSTKNRPYGRFERPVTVTYEGEAESGY